MGTKFTDKITDEVWGKWFSVPVIAIISVLTGVPICLTILSHFSITITEANKIYKVHTEMAIILTLLVIVCLAGLNIWNFLFVYFKHHIRRAVKGKIGILIFFDTDNKEIYIDTRRKFGSEFNKRLISQFDVVYVPFGMKTIKCREKGIVNLLNRKRCLLFLNFGINVDKDGQVVSYDMCIDGSIIHSHYNEHVEKEFKKIVSANLRKFRNIQFTSKDMISKMRIAAGEMSITCEYIIGLSLFLNGDFRSAEIILKKLGETIVDVDKWQKMCFSIQRMRYEMFMIISYAFLSRYQRTCAEEESLDKMNVYLEKANECCGNTYEYYLNKAYFCVAKNCDTKLAKEYINKCKQMKKIPLIWKYSEAFLKAYENKSINSICTSYKSALLVPYNTQDLIVYIEAVLEKNPDKYGLMLALGILYYYAGDEVLSKDYIDKYLLYVPDYKKAKDILIKRKMISYNMFLGSDN